MAANAILATNHRQSLFSKMVAGLRYAAFEIWGETWQAGFCLASCWQA
jgi:hypothetical protein